MKNDNALHKHTAKRLTIILTGVALMLTVMVMVDNHVDENSICVDSGTITDIISVTPYASEVEIDNERTVFLSNGRFSTGENICLNEEYKSPWGKD